MYSFGYLKITTPESPEATAFWSDLFEPRLLLPELAVPAASLPAPVPPAFPPEPVAHVTLEPVIDDAKPEPPFPD